MTASEGPLLLWIGRLPHSTVHLSESIRLAAMSSALDLPVRLLFVGEGVRALVRGQEPYRYSPPIEKLLTGIVSASSPALVHRPSLLHRGLDSSTLLAPVPAQLVDDHDAADWLIRARQVVPL
jgi:sulfur relay (sulfurtransferase) DsrF/TusC family protein